MEPHIEERICEVVLKDPACIRHGYYTYDLTRQFLRVGLTQDEQNLERKLKKQRGAIYG